MEVLELFLEFFRELPLIGQAMLPISMVTGFMILYACLNPIPNKKDNTKKYKVEIKSIKAEVLIK